MQIFIKFLKDLYRDKIKKSLKIRICSRMRNIDFWRSNCKSVLFLYAYLKTFSEEVFLKIIFEIFDIFIIFQDFMKSINFHWFSYENHHKNQNFSIKNWDVQNLDGFSKTTRDFDLETLYTPSETARSRKFHFSLMKSLRKIFFDNSVL